MKAITITQEIKDLNSQLFKNLVVGTIRKLSQVPKSFYSLTYNQGQRTDGYHTLDNSIHESDGFYNVVTPVIDDSTQKLGALFFDVDKFTYPVITKTQEEQDEYTQAQEDNDNSSQLFQKYKTDGVLGFDRAMALIIRKVDNGTITANQGKLLAQGLYPSLEPLYKGLWQLVKMNLDNETPPNNSELLIIFNKIKNGVDNYVTNNY